MGRHTAADGAAAHPLVAAALAQRPADAAPTHRGDAASAPDGGSVGWPAAPEPGSGGVGWPGRRGEEEHDDPSTTGRPEEAAPVTSRRGWRRLFGAPPAA